VLGWVWDTHSTSRLQVTVIFVLPCVGGYEVSVWSSQLWHNTHNKFHLLPFNHSQDIKCIQTDISCEDMRLGEVNDAHAQKIEGNGVIITRNDFKQLSHSYY
jgi:hypothetical protein